MSVKNRRGLMLPLNIQLFADGDGDNGNGGGTPPKTYSEEEYNKMKAAFDKASSELAEAKKKEKAKMSEEEKKKAENEEKAKEFESMKKELKQMKLSKSLSKVFTDSEECEGIANAFIEDDIEKVIELISKSQENFRKQVETEAKSKFSKSAKIPGAADDDSGSEKSKIAELAKKKSTKIESKTDAWDKFKNR